MKVGDLVKYIGPGYDGPDCGIGIVLRVLTRGSHRKHTSVEVHWSGWNETMWSVTPRLRVII